MTCFPFLVFRMTPFAEGNAFGKRPRVSYIQSFPDNVTTAVSIIAPTLIIFRPKAMRRGVLSIKTTSPKEGMKAPYDGLAANDNEGVFHYRFVGTDPLTTKKRDARGFRRPILSGGVMREGTWRSVICTSNENMTLVHAYYMQSVRFDGPGALAHALLLSVCGLIQSI
jgi:hypothetical protein